ncbi:lysylphosphatidylglycerol synthase domain-containing protein [Streptacidiphilus monticola]
MLGLGVVAWLLVHEFGRGGGGGAAGVLALVASAAGRPLWLAAAAALAAAGFVVATMSFVGFVPERLDLRRSLLAQLAGGFANMVAPAGLGGMALGTRFLHRSGIPAGQAVTSVGVSQVVGVALHGLLVVAFGVLAGTRLHLPWHAALLHPSAGVVITATAAALLASAVLGLVCCSPRTRRWAAERLRAAVSGNLPRMVDLARRQPGKVAVGVTGQLLVSLVASACLYACGVALGERTAFAAVALANLVGGTVGLAVPTPGSGRS